MIERGLAAYRPTRPAASALALHHLLERQHYRLAHWRLAGSEINYRRFFDINSWPGCGSRIAGTFQAVHALVRRSSPTASCKGCGSITSTACAIRISISAGCNG